METGTYRFNYRTGKFERCTDVPELPKGTIVWSIGPGAETLKWAMTGNGREVIKLDEPYEGAYFSGTVDELGRYAKPISEKFGIGFYYDTDAEPATDEEIAAARERNARWEAEQKAKARAERESKERAKAAQLARYKDFYGEPGDGKVVTVAKHIRKDLKTAFPGTKFSVTKRDSGCIDVHWTDGPETADVRAIIGKHEHPCTPDRWNDDLWEHTPTAFTEVFGGVDFLFLHRTESRREGKR